MSFAAVNDPVAAPLHNAPPKGEESETKPKYKSHKKKFLKQKRKFERAMIESTADYEEEQRLIRIAKRLREENDQLLELVLHKNGSLNLPLNLKYDIGSPTPDVESVPSLESDRSPQHRPSIKAEDDHNPNVPSGASRLSELTKSLSTLTTRLPHTTLASVSAENILPSDLESDEPTGYYSPSHELSHLATLDHSLGIGPSVEVPRPASSSLRIADKEKERHKQQELNNPVSAYNWLRKNQPQVFLQDSEKDAEKSAVQNAVKKDAAPKASPKPKAPRRNAVKKEKEEVEVVYDDEGYVIGGPGFDDIPPPGSGRGKRKRQGDEAYRPKGGSSRANKRKKRASGEKDWGSGTPATIEEGS